MFKKVAFSLLKKIKPYLPIIGLIGAFFSLVLTVLVIAAPVAAAAEVASEVIEDVDTFFERFAGFFSGRGWNTGEEAYFKLMSEHECDDVKIVTATIMYYYQSNREGVTIGDGTTPSENDSGEYIDSEGNEFPYGEMYTDAKRLFKKLAKGMEEYETYVKDKFLESDPYKKLLNTYPNKDEIFDGMISLSKSVICPGGDSVGESFVYSCPGVTVTGDHAGTYPLEEYVAGVVSKEHPSATPENLKVQAIMARTYVLKQTNYCTSPIENSEDTQVFAPTTDNKYINAAQETTGKVLSLNGTLISTYFASYPEAGYGSFPSFPACSDVVCDDTSCTTTFYKMPNGESFELTTPIKNPNGNYWNGRHLNDQRGHCYGYSQVAGMDLEVNHSMNYNQIINTFHSSGVVISAGTRFSEGGWVIRTTAPTRANSVYFEFGNVHNNVGQCVWYAASRAIEILTELKEAGKIDAEQADKAINSLMNTWADAKDWYTNTSDLFSKTTDSSNPQAGSIIVWSGGNGHSYGHVAIIEEVKDNKIIITDGWATNTKSCPNTWDCIHFQKKEMTLDNFHNNYIKHGSSGHYTFKGYVNFVNSSF